MKKCIIYGAGEGGASIYSFLEYIGKKDLVQCFCDKRADDIKTKCNLSVYDYEMAKTFELPFVIAVGERFHAQIIDLFTLDDIPYYDSLEAFCVSGIGMSKTEFIREYCAFVHIDNNIFYTKAENCEELEVFWKPGDFYDLFKYLDCENMIEFACGHGRHVPYYLEKVGHVTLVDVLKKNIDICRKRFGDDPRITYYQNNGVDLHDLSNNMYTAVFSYDAVVHFELLDIAKYLRETNRVLKKGGLALFHHSNYCDDYKASFLTAPEGRSFMDKKIFAYLSYRAGFEVVEQRTIDWGLKDLDCLTLIRKPM